jgi:protein-disulfide isomerase
VILVVIVAVVLGIVLTRNTSGGGTSGPSSYDGPTIGIPAGMPTTGSSSNAPLPYASDVAKMFKGIPQKGLTLGDPNAPVTLIEYIDLQCPACQQFELTELPTLVQKYVRPGKMNIQMRTWNIIDANHPGTDDSLRGQKVTIGASKQNKAFDFASVLYNNQGIEGTNWLNNAMIGNIAASVDGLNLSQLAKDANSAATKSAYTDVNMAAARGQFAATPTILLATRNGAPQVVKEGVPDLPTLESQIEARLNQLKQK